MKKQLIALQHFMDRGGIHAPGDTFEMDDEIDAGLLAEYLENGRAKAVDEAAAAEGEKHDA